VLRQLPQVSDPNLLVGINTSDDAAVYRLTDDIALVQTVDFFPPVVDDPYYFGAIAVANAVSDVYAMGGRPLTGLNLVCYPIESLPEEILVEILRGGADKAKEAGVTIVGGHTIDDPEPKYGMSVTGLITPGKQVTNAGAQSGDILYLTKPLGIGIITTAIKAGVATEEVIQLAMKTMATLNKAAAEAMMKVGVNACTDITGYGLLGHLLEMTKGSHVRATIYRSRVPVIPEAVELADMGVVPGGTVRNMAFLEGQVEWHPETDELDKFILADAQTSGGLLIAVPPERAPALEAALKAAGVDTIAQIGECSPHESLTILVKP